MLLKKIAKKILLLVKDNISASLINGSLFKIQRSSITNLQDKKIIAFCLFGNDQKYFSNIDACMASYRQFFPDWAIRVYVSRDVQEVIVDRLKLSGEVIVMKSGGIDYRYTFWRFLVLDDSGISIALIRDIDSVASNREKLMVDAWIASGKKLHIIRDHPSHVDLIMAGMWGMVTNGVSQQMKKKILQFKKVNKFGVDQAFLKSVYYEFETDMFVNDICKRFNNEEPMIIPHDDTYFYVGEINSINPYKERHINELKNFIHQNRLTNADGQR